MDHKFKILYVKIKTYLIVWEYVVNLLNKQIILFPNQTINLHSSKNINVKIAFGQEAKGEVLRLADEFFLNLLLNRFRD